MADLKETAIWEPTIRQLETSDPVMGGENGVSNTAPRQLANRTLFLNDNKVDKTTKITAGTGLLGGGTAEEDRTLSIDFASDEEVKSGKNSNKSIHPSSLAKSVYYLANSRFDGKKIVGNANDFEIGTRYLCSSALTNTPILNAWWDDAYALIETRYSDSDGQKIQIAWGCEKPNLAMRSCISNEWTEWRSIMGADWASTSSDGIRNKPSTLGGFGIKDWKIENIITANASQANSIGQGVFSFATVTSDAPKWSSGEGIGANKMFQLGPDSWNTQMAVQGYGECVFIRSRRTAGGPYQPWKRLDGGDWAATEEQAGHIYNKPNIAKSHLASGYARLSNGTIIQWGAVTAVNGQANWVYPIAFPNAALQVFASQDGVIGVTYTVGASVDPAALKTQAKVTSTLTSGSDAFSCFAIGY